MPSSNHRRHAEVSDTAQQLPEAHYSIRTNVDREEPHGDRVQCVNRYERLGIFDESLLACSIETAMVYNSSIRAGKRERLADFATVKRLNYQVEWVIRS